MKKIILLQFCILFSFLSCKKETKKDDNNSNNYYTTGGTPSTQNEINAAGYAPNLGTGTLPSSFELAMPPILNQGSQGSCVSFATGYYMMSYFLKEQANLSYNNTALCSPSFLYNQIVNGKCENGSTFSQNLTILKDKGICTLSDMPYNENDCSTQPSQQQLSSALNYRITYFKAIEKNDIAKIKSYVNNGYPVCFLMKADSMFMNLQTPYILNSSGGFYNSNHALTIVGWDDTKSAFKVINSWGTNFGENGFFWISYSFFPNSIAGTSDDVWIAKANITQNTSQSIIQLSGNLNFGSINVNQTSSQTLTISNTGTSVLNVTSISLPNGFSGSWTGSIAPNSSQNVTITFSPTSAINYSGTLTVNSNASSGLNTISVSGIGANISTGPYSSPAINTYVNCPPSIVGTGLCNGYNYDGNTVKFRVISLNSNSITFELDKCNEADNFQSSGTFYIKEGDYCGTVVGSVAYNSGSSSVTLTISTNFIGTKTFSCVVDPDNQPTNLRYNGGSITVTY